MYLPPSATSAAGVGQQALLDREETELGGRGRHFGCTRDVCWENLDLLGLHILDETMWSRFDVARSYKCLKL